MTYRCSKCNGTSVQLVAWIDPNTDEVQEDYGSWDAIVTKWCCDCAEHVLLTDDPEPDKPAPDPNPKKKEKS